MLPSFQFKQIPHIVFGSGVRSEIAKNAGQFGNSTLLITGGGSFTGSVHFDQLSRQLADSHIDASLACITKEPSPEAVDQIVDIHRGTPITSVIAIGGGSVLDGGKAVAAMLTEEGSVQEYLEGIGSKRPSGSTLAFIAVPTTSGTGSETTANAVLSSVGPKGFKKSLRHNNFIPDIAIIDPDLTLSCPPALTATCGMDCFTQLVEGYLSTNASPITDNFALQGIEATGRSLQIAYNDGSNIEARSDLSYAAMLSGIVLANAGLGTVHGFASAVGGILPIPHGVVCGTLMEPVNHLTLQRLREDGVENVALQKYTQLGKLFSQDIKKSDDWYQDHFIHTLAHLSYSLSIPNFSSYEITGDTVDTIIAETSNKYNPVQFDRAELESLFRSRC